MQTPDHPQTLARWRCEPQLWRDFVEYDSSDYWGSARAAWHLIVGAAVVTLLLLFLLVVLPYLITGNFGRGTFELIAVIIVAGGIAMLVGIFIWNQRSIKLAKLKAASGEMSITLHDFRVNDFPVAEWKFGQLGWRFYDAVRESVNLAPGKKLDILRIKFVAYQPGENGGTRRDEQEQRIPVPPQNLADADAVIRRLCAERDAAESAWLQETGGYGHEFLNRTCRKCGTEIERIVMTSRDCPK